jgi:hypothetical protein
MPYKSLAQERYFNANRGKLEAFLATMPTETKIFLTMAVLGLAGTLLVLKWLI